MVPRCELDERRLALRGERRAIRAAVAQHTAKALVIAPEQFAPMRVIDILLAIPYVADYRARSWLRRIRIDGLAYGSELSWKQRHMLAGILASFAKAEGASPAGLLPAPTAARPSIAPKGRAVNLPMTA